MWECPNCGYLFYAGSASSIEANGETVEGVECPNCGEFIGDEELEEQAASDQAAGDK